MKTSKTAKEIRNTLAQMDDALRLPELGAKQKADLLAEKSKLLVTLLNFERETEEDKQDIRIRELEQELATALAAKPAVRPMTQLTEVEIALQAYAKEKEENNAH